MKPIDLSLDPELMQTLVEQAQTDTTYKTPAQLYELQKKRKANTKPTMRQTRDQRAFDVRVKLLKPDEDRLRKLRSLQMGNYFVVPVSELVSIRNMTSRELRERGIKYVTTKFVFGHYEYIKVLRYNPIHDKDE
jgi:hypothetical protein